MYDTLSERQIAILKGVVIEFAKTGSPVGSSIISEKYVNASGATIRNDMSVLTKMGYLQKSHFSAGRYPTSIGFRYYINRLMVEDDINYIDEMRIKQHLHESRFEKEKLIKTAIDELADSLRYVSVAISDNSVLYSGISDILDYEEFRDLDNLRGVLAVIENYSMLNSVFNKYIEGELLKVLVGDECGFSSFEPCAIVYAQFSLYHGTKGFIGVVGPVRMVYNQVIPKVRMVAETLTDVTRGW